MPLKNEAEQMIGMAAIIRDVTARYNEMRPDLSKRSLTLGGLQLTSLERRMLVAVIACLALRCVEEIAAFNKD